MQSFFLDLKPAFILKIANNYVNKQSLQKNGSIGIQTKRDSTHGIQPTRDSIHGIQPTRDSTQTVNPV